MPRHVTRPLRVRHAFVPLSGSVATATTTLAAETTATTVTSSSALRMTRQHLFTRYTSPRDVLRMPPPRVQSPLAQLRPPPPPSARDVLPFGSLNKSHRPRYYYNVNAVAASPRPNNDNNNDDNDDNDDSSVAARVVSPMDVARLTRNNNNNDCNNNNNNTNISNNVNINGHAAEATDVDGAPRVCDQRARHATANTTTTATASTSGLASSPYDQHHHTTTMTDTPARPPPSPPPAQQHQHYTQTYEEHCIVGWSLRDFYRVVADVGSYSAFLPWCVSSHVHTHCRVHDDDNNNNDNSDNNNKHSSSSHKVDGDDAHVCVEEMTATLTVGFSWLTESYTSHVTLRPGQSIVATLYDGNDNDNNDSGSSSGDEDTSGSASDTIASRSRAVTSSTTSGGAATRECSGSSSGGSGGGLLTSLLRKAVHTASAAARKSILQQLRCEWHFVPRPGHPHEVEVRFAVSFVFTNPLYSRLIMSNIVSIMIKSFERRCEALYGPPSTPRRSVSATM